MKNRKALPFAIAAITVIGLCTILSVSCASTGNFMPIAQGDTVRGRGALNTQAYIKLLEAAQEKYRHENNIDIRDII